MKKTNQYAISYSLGVNVYAKKPEGVEDRISLDNTRARFTAEAEHYLSFLRERYEEEINQQTK